MRYSTLFYIAWVAIYMVRYLVNAQGAKKIAPEGDFCSEPVWSLEKPVFLCKREQVKPPIYLFSRCASCSSPCGTSIARVAREDWCEGSKTIEK